MRRLFLVAGLALNSAAATAANVQLAPPDALRCMTPAEAERGAIKYPAQALRQREGGVVKAKMRFERADQGPKVEVLSDTLDAFKDAVSDHLRSFRVPCLAEGQFAEILIDFKFDPFDGRPVLWSRAREVQRDRRGSPVDCLVSPKGKPEYPMSALRREDQGTVAVELRFNDATSAPVVKVLDDTPHPHLIEAVTEVVAAMRVPCLQGEPVSLFINYAFKIEGADRFVLKDMPLVTLLRAVRGIQGANVYFDFNTMKCPFELRLRMSQPIRDNRFGEIGESVPERAFFIDWLSRQRLNLPRDQQNLLIDQHANISVPCGVLSLGNEGGGGASK